MSDKPRALIVGASRGIGLGLVREFAARGWEVTGTVRNLGGAEALKSFAEASGGAVRIEIVDTADAASGEALRKRQADQMLDLFLVNAGVSGPTGKNPRTVTRDEFSDLFVTNALGPVRLAEMFSGQVRPRTGIVAMMSSGLGSVQGVGGGGWDLYGASKAALNSFTRSFAARHRDKGLTVLSLSPGWVRTDMGGANAAIDVETSTRGLADVIERARGDRRDGFFNYKGEELPW